MAERALVVGVAVLMTMVVLIGTAHALTHTINKDITCGNRNWGERDHPINTFGNSVSFGRTADCGYSIPYEGRYNVATITTNLAGNPNRYDISWQSIFQGTTPWNQNAVRYGALYDNTAFPLPSDQPSDYRLKAQWVWTQDEAPNRSGKSIHANYLTNLWFVWDKPNTNNDYFLVIDFLWDRLKEDGTRGKWKQATTWDVDTMPGVQYYDVYCEVIRGDTVYHYNVVLDNNTTRAGIWNERSVNIDRYISDAFKYSYDRKAGCTDSTPGARSNFVIVDQENGIEVQARDAGATGKAKGAYSFSELWH